MAILIFYPTGIVKNLRSYSRLQNCLQISMQNLLQEVQQNQKKHLGCSDKKNKKISIDIYQNDK